MKIFIWINFIIQSTSCWSQEYFSLQDCIDRECSLELMPGYYTDFSYDIQDSQGYFLSQKEENRVRQNLNPILHEIQDFYSSYSMTETFSQSFEAEDKKLHFQVGSVIGYFSGKACEYGFTPFKIESNKKTRFFCAVAGATLAGIAKEFYDMTDQENHTVDPYDALATAFGGTTSFKFIELKF